jgi:hypothetical protein
VQNAKEASPSDSTDAGRQSNSNDEQAESVLASIRVSFDPDSNLSEESDVHSAKH